MKKMKKILLSLFFFTLLLLSQKSYSQVIISQYYEGSSNNKWIEITNIGTTSINLTSPQLYLCLYSNALADDPASAAGPTSKFTLSGTIASGSSILFKNSSAVLPSYASGTSTTTCGFNGDDLVIISTSNAASAWADRTDVVGNGNSWGNDKSLYRNSNITSPNTTFTLSEWTESTYADVDAASSSDSKYLGYHAFSATPPTPTITVSPSSLTTFSYVVDNGPSNNLAFTVSGSNLTNHITITPPAQYEISLDGTNFFLTYGSITLVISGGAVAPTTIYVRLKENLPIGNYNQDITLSSFGAPDMTVSCSGSVIPVLPNLVINEILAAPDATSGDANGDGTVNTSQDEFVEIVNNDTYAVNLYGYTLSDGNSVRHTFSSITLNPNEAIVIFGGGSPTGFLTYAITASTGILGLNNSGDDVILKNNSGFTIDSYTYGSEAGNNQSITRDPDLTGSSFVQHSTATGSDGTLFSPGNHIDGTPFSIPPPPAPPVPLDWRYILALFSLLGIVIVYRRLR